MSNETSQQAASQAAPAPLSQSPSTHSVVSPGALRWQMTGGGDEYARAPLSGLVYELWCTPYGFTLQVRERNSVTVLLEREPKRDRAKEVALADWEARYPSMQATSRSRLDIAALHASVQMPTVGLSLKERILVLQALERQALEKHQAARLAVQLAEAERAKCQHDFEPPPAAYAHEGGCCRHCGINELFAHTLRSRQLPA